MVGDASDAAGGREVTGQNADGSRLAGAVWSEEADDLSLGDLKVDIVNGQDGAKVFGEMSNLNHRAILCRNQSSHRDMQLVRLMMPIMSRPTRQSHIITAYFGDKFG
jgi:hypothetical protein